MSSIKDQIRQEIERRKNIHINMIPNIQKCAECDDLLAFIDSLPEEEPSKGLDVTDFCKPIDPDIAQCVADNWWEMAGEPVSKDLEEELKMWWEENRSHINVNHTMYWYMQNLARHFAEWGAKHLK